MKTNITITSIIISLIFISTLKSQSNYSLSFDGTNDRVELPSGILNSLDNFSMEVWFKADNNQTDFSNIFQEDGGSYIRYVSGTSLFKCMINTSMSGVVEISITPGDSGALRTPISV